MIIQIFLRFLYKRKRKNYLITFLTSSLDVDSDVEKYDSPPKQLTNKHLHPVQKVRQRRRARTASLEDEDADLQGRS